MSRRVILRPGRPAVRSTGSPPMKGMRLLLRALLGILILAVSPGLPAQQSAQSADAGRLVVVGDVHGAYDELVRLLQVTSVINESLAWSGGETRLVSLGDLLDRGPDSRRVMDLLRRL